MKKEKLYLITEDTYHQHIDQEVYLYGLLRQLAFLAGKIKEHEDVENFKETALHFGHLADEAFDNGNIPGRYLVYGDKADLATLKEKELLEIEGMEYGDDEEPACLRDALEHFADYLDGLSDTLTEALAELDALAGE